MPVIISWNSNNDYIVKIILSEKPNMPLFYKLLIISTIAFLFAEKINAQEISSKDAFQMIKDSSDVKIIDVRTVSEYSEGHIENSIQIDYKDNSFKDKISLLDKDKTYLVYCRSGKRSRMAQTIMKENGFEKVYNLEDGIIGWKAEAYPLVK